MSITFQENILLYDKIELDDAEEYVKSSLTFRWFAPYQNTKLTFCAENKLGAVTLV